MGGGTELRSVGTLDCAGASLVGARTIDEIFRLDDTTTLREAVEVIVRGVVTRCAVGAIMIATELTDWFHASRPLIDDLDEVEVTVCDDGEADFYAGANGEFEV